MNDKNDIRVIHINIHSMHSNIDNFMAFLDSLNDKFQIICFTETWLNKNRMIENIIPGYRSYHSMRSESVSYGGGVAIYISDELNSVEIESYTKNLAHIECIFAKVSHSGGNLIVGSCYRPPSSNVNDFINEINNIFSQNTSNSDYILCGDYNLNLMHTSSDRLVGEFVDSLACQGLINTILLPTRVTDHSATLIDNIFVSNNLTHNSGVFGVNISDHYPIFTNLKNILGHNDQKSNYSRYRLLNDLTLTNFSLAFNNENFDDILTSSDLNLATCKLDQKIRKLYNIHCPIITKKNIKT